MLIHRGLPRQQEQGKARRAAGGHGERRTGALHGGLPRQQERGVVKAGEAAVRYGGEGFDLAPAVTEPPGLFTYMVMSLLGATESR
jgi:hypothetical protein